MDVCQQILRVLGERARQAAQELVDRAVAANLTRQAALEAHPLSIDILVALELRAVPLDAGKRLYLYNLFGHYLPSSASRRAVSSLMAPTSAGINLP